MIAIKECQANLNPAAEDNWQTQVDTISDVSALDSAHLHPYVKSCNEPVCCISIRSGRMWCDVCEEGGKESEGWRRGRGDS